MKAHINPAHAGRTFEALRGIGYDLNASVADLVDNSITPRVGSDQVDIIFKKEFDQFLNKEKFILKVVDNGCGMTNEELWDAMTIGADVGENYSDRDLSRYGFGMKTASLAHCQVLHVISKKNNKVSGYKWDLNKLKGKKRWEMYEMDKLETNDVIEHCDVKLGKTWTIVVWKDLFQIEKDYSSYTKPAMGENYYYNLIAELKVHLGMVFHRFLDGSIDGSQLDLRVNKAKVDPWDPFQRQEEFTEEINFNEQQSSFQLSGSNNPVIIKGYIMPNQDQYSSQDAWKSGRGLLTWNDSQGYYIYRENRIIRYGGYQGIRGKDEHDKLARISIDISRDMDKEFKLNVSKNLLQFPAELRHHLKENINKYVTGPARDRYDKKYEREKHVVKNRIRNKKKKLDQLALDLMNNSNISTTSSFLNKKKVKVNNPNGKYTSNDIMEFFEVSKRDSFEVLSDNIDSNLLWKIVCNDQNKFKVIVNSKHPFYELIYKRNNPRAVTEAVDALIFSLAFSELKIRNNKNEYMLQDFKSSCSSALKEFIKAKFV